MPAVDNWWHELTLYMPLVISIYDLCETIIKWLETKYNLPLSLNIGLPCEEWIRLQFWSANSTTAVAIQYTGWLILNIKFKIDNYVKIIQMHIIMHVYFSIYGNLLFFITVIFVLLLQTINTKCQLEKVYLHQLMYVIKKI